MEEVNSQTMENAQSQVNLRYGWEAETPLMLVSDTKWKDWGICAVWIAKGERGHTSPSRTELYARNKSKKELET
jgi:hypothetical protein